jgi:ABC-type Mn2+/Zn2+ transport system permease subunit
MPAGKAAFSRPSIVRHRPGWGKSNGKSHPNSAGQGFVAVAVAECSQIVGVLLVFTLMVGPAAAAMNLTRGLALAVALSAGLALAEAWGGLTLAYYTDWPTSVWITALSGIAFFGAAEARRFAG